MKKKSLLVAGIILCISILLSACEKEQADMEDIMYIGVEIGRASCRERV